MTRRMTRLAPRRFARGATLAIALLAPIGAVLACQDSVDPVIEPEAELQAAIREAISETEDAATFMERLQALRKLGGPAHQKLIPQLLYFSEHGKDVRESMAAGVIIEQLRIPKQQVVQALVPYLDTPHENIAKAVRNVLQGYEDRDDDRPPNFSIYREPIETALRAGEAPPAGLVRYLYASDPGAALLLLLRAAGLRDADQIKPILWAEHVVADVLWKQRHGFLAPDAIEPAALRELDQLARHPAWWARLYVAEILRQHAAFRRPALLSRLARDQHALVRETVGRIEGEK